MTKTSNFRLPVETLADLDILATQEGISRTEVICRALADRRARVTGLVPASAVQPPPPVASEEAPAAADAPPVTEARHSVAPPTPRPAFGPVQSLRSRPVAIPDLPNVHRSLNPITRGRLS